jgi:hypothetical protein
MSGWTHVEGEFTIEPPLEWHEFKDSRFAPDHHIDRWNPDLELVVDEEAVDTDQGPLLKRTAAVLRIREMDEYRENKLEKTVQEAFDAFPGHTFTGFLYGEGEDNPDMWRIVVRGNRAIRVTPRIIWPAVLDDEVGTV